MPRHQTLRALVDWSYDLLAEQEQEILRQLAVFAGSFDLDAAESILASDRGDPSQRLDIITALCDKSLIEVVGEADTARWRLLETLREYARQRLEEAEPQAAGRLLVRHRDHYLSVADACDAGFRSSAQGAAQHRIENDYENMRLVGLWQVLTRAGAAGGAAA